MRGPIRLQDFLQFLEERFGILVDRPPAPFTGGGIYGGGT